MASREFAKSCCTVYPYKLGKHQGGFFEAGVKSDPHYFYNLKIIDGDVVYVATPDLPDFVNVFFVNLPRGSRITLVTGSEDIGAPWEIFHPNRTNYFDYKMSSLWPKGQIMGMREFILDERLVSWYAQNYDLYGCNAFTCSGVKPAKESKYIVYFCYLIVNFVFLSMFFLHSICAY